ncbi:MAG: ComF family protein [Silicimonas sp.]|nr:ComF family protein [Silicimonas sp.]
MGLQRVLSIVYPTQCVLCAAQVDKEGGLCGACWKETPFINGLACDACGAPLPGYEKGRAHCDDCLVTPRPWQSGRAAFQYDGNGRRLVLALKHGDRTDLAKPAAMWMQNAGRDILTDDTLLVPVPIHWSRLLRRRYNQAAELSRAVSKLAGLETCQDALLRTKRTVSQNGMTVAQRQLNMEGAISANPKRYQAIEGRRVCLIDDVMTSGATLTACTTAAFDAGADQVFVMVLARVAKTP